MGVVRNGLLGMALVGGAAVPGSAWAVASFDASAQIIVAVGNSLGVYNGDFGPIPLPPGDGDGSLDAGDAFNNTGTAAEIAVDLNGGPTMSGTGGLSTRVQNGTPTLNALAPTASFGFNPAAEAGSFLDWNSGDGSKTLATGQKAQLSGSAQGGGSLDVGLFNNVPTGGQSHQVVINIFNESTTEDLVLDFVAIPNLLVSVFSDTFGDNVEVEAAVNLGFFGIEVGDVNYMMERGAPADQILTATKQSFPGFTAVSFAQNASIVDGVFNDSLVGAQQPVPEFAWAQGTLAPNSEGLFLIEFVAFGRIETSETSAPVPVPAALPLLAAALGGFGFMAHRRRKAA